MKSCHPKYLATFLFSLFSAASFAQEQRAFNQNSSRSNHTTRAFNQNASRSNHTRLSFTFAPTYSIATNSSSDSLLFRGSGAGFRLGADYFFGAAGISFVSGFGSSSADDATINNFLKQFPVPSDQLAITKARQQNMYLLLGPSVRFGNAVAFYAHAKTGLFINNSGLVSIQQKGAQRAAYRNEPGEKSIYPGFLTGAGIQYSTNSDWSFGLAVDYLNTRSEVNNYDIRRGGGIEALKLSRNISDIVTGITIRYNIQSPRDHASGQASGKRQVGKPKYEDIGSVREAGSGQATGKRSYQPGQPVYGNAVAEESCGPVTQRVTHPDGTTEEMTFACPADAAEFNSRKSPGITVPRQTQGATFGEKVNAGLHQAGSALSQGMATRDNSSTNIISGRLAWASGGSSAIVTNRMVADPGAGTSNARQTQQTSFGTLVRLSSREAGSGIATGKRSREAGSGIATGRRQYEPVFIEGQGEVCNPCQASAKMSGVSSNPLYTGSGTNGNNPLHKSSEPTAGGEDDDCDGIAGIAISLIEPATGAVVARTTTEKCGDFFFANVPDGNYIIKASGSFTGKKGYDVSVTSKTDLLGTIEQSGEPMQLFLNTGDAMQQKAGISTSRSNIRCKSLAIIEADLDGDGEYESLRATATFSDGSARDITAARKTVSGTKSIVLDGNTFNMRRRVEVLKSNRQGDPNARRLTSITIFSNSNGFTATGTFSDGSSRDVSESVDVNSDHTGVRQYNLALEDADNDGQADAVVKTKTKSNQSNDRIAGGDADNDGIWSPRSNITKIIQVGTGDADDDGATDIQAGMPSSFASSRDRRNEFFQNGDIPTQQRPGNPIGGLIIKGGKNPGGNLRTTQSNENGEFEFTDLEPGDYTFTIEQKIFIEDETPVTVGQQANTRVQDHNSSRSNKTASSIATDDTDTNKPNTRPARWTAPESLNKTINTTRANIKSMLASLDDLEDQLDNDASGNRALINTSRSNIKSQRLSVYSLKETLNDIQYMDKTDAVNVLEQKMAAINRQLLSLQETLKDLGSQYSSISNVLKTKHDTVKNSISNIR